MALIGNNINMSTHNVVFQDCYAAGPRTGYSQGGAWDGARSEWLTLGWQGARMWLREGLCTSRP